MEEKKLDTNSIIGFILIFGILLYMLYTNQPSPEEIEAKKQAQIEQQKQEAAKNAQQSEQTANIEEFIPAKVQDSAQFEALKSKLGAFAYAMSVADNNDETVVTTKLLTLKFNNKGGFLSEVKLNQFVDHDSIPIYLVKDNNTSFSLNFGTTDSRILNTKDLYFQPVVTKNGENTVVSMRLKVSELQYLEYRYEVKPDDYMIDFAVKSQGLENVINGSYPLNVEWQLKGRSQAKSVSYENRYTRLTYQFEGDKIDKLAQMSDDEETEKDLSWISYRQHFFSSILVPENPIESVNLISKDLVKDEDVDTTNTKFYA